MRDVDCLPLGIPILGIAVAELRSLIPAFDGSVWVLGSFESGSLYGGPPLLTPDALASCVPSYPDKHTDVKHLSSDGSQLLYGTLLDGVLSLDASGVVRIFNSASLYQTIDLTAPQPPHITCVAIGAASHHRGFGLVGVKRTSGPR